jgi:uncharacterized protein YqeY
MKIQEKITQDLKEAMLQKNESKKSLLRVIIGEFNRHGKIVEDAKATNILKSMLENATQQNNLSEVEILNEYLPKQLTNDQLQTVIGQLIEEKKYSSIKEMGKIMADLKAGYPGQYDGKIANDYIKLAFNQNA